MVKLPVFGAFGIVAVVVSVLVAQTPSSPTFEVASIKPNKSSDAAGPGVSFDGFRAIGMNTPLLTLIRQAYQVQGFQIVGGPSWITSDRFDIVAKIPSAGNAPLPRGAGGLMMQSLLAERFKLTIHHETRELPVYALVIARHDGKAGPQFHQPAVDCYALLRQDPLRPDARRPPLPPGFVCGGMRPGPGQLSDRMATMRQLAEFLSPQVGRIVLDKTDITGPFDMDLTWTPGLIASDASAATSGSSPDGTTSIYTAVEEQLGLKLESTTGPVDVLVIDHIEQPTPD